MENHELECVPSFLVLFTGLSGAGKTTLSKLVARELNERGIHTYRLDGDVLRKGLNADLAFTKKDRTENLRRMAEVAKLMLETEKVVLAAFIAPLIVDRKAIKKSVGSNRYVEVFVDTPLAVCEQRDTKGLYKKARMGTIQNFTGISQDYETPVHPDLTISHTIPLKKAVTNVCDLILHKIKTSQRIELNSTN